MLCIVPNVPRTMWKRRLTGYLRYWPQTGKPVAWVLWSEDTPLDLESRLLRRGFQKQDQSLPSMACDLLKLESMHSDNTQSQRAKVETQSDFLAHFVPVLMEGFDVPVTSTGPVKVWKPFIDAYVSASFVERPTIHHYLNWEGDEPTVTGTLVYEKGGWHLHRGH